VGGINLPHEEEFPPKHHGLQVLVTSVKAFWYPEDLEVHTRTLPYLDILQYILLKKQSSKYKNIDIKKK